MGSSPVARPVTLGDHGEECDLAGELRHSGLFSEEYEASAEHVEDVGVGCPGHQFVGEMDRPAKDLPISSIRRRDRTPQMLRRGPSVVGWNPFHVPHPRLPQSTAASYDFRPLIVAMGLRAQSAVHGQYHPLEGRAGAIHAALIQSTMDILAVASAAGDTPRPRSPGPFPCLAEVDSSRAPKPPPPSSACWVRSTRSVRALVPVGQPPTEGTSSQSQNSVTTALPLRRATAGASRAIPARSSLRVCRTTLIPSPAPAALSPSSPPGLYFISATLTPLPHRPVGWRRPAFRSTHTPAFEACSTGGQPNPCWTYEKATSGVDAKPTVGWVSWLLWNYVSPLISTGYKRSIDVHDLYLLPEVFCAQHYTAAMFAAWHANKDVVRRRFGWSIWHAYKGILKRMWALKILIIAMTLARPVILSLLQRRREAQPNLPLWIQVAQGPLERIPR